ncbi:hypothetical protein ACQJBY_007981 [Aegilops geniculata]
MAHHIARDMAYSAMAWNSGEGSSVPRRTTSAPATALDPRRQGPVYRDPPIVFTHAPPAGSASNWHTEDGAANEESFVQQPFTSHGGGDSDGVLNTHGGMHDADEDEDISSQPLLPYVGMEFDSIEDAQKFYNDYAFGTGFGSRIASSKNCQKKGPKQLNIL